MASTTSTTSVEDRGPSLIAMTWIFTVLASSAVVTRLVLRFRRSSIDWDDIFMCLAAVRIIPFLLKIYLLTNWIGLFLRHDHLTHCTLQ